MIEKVTHQTQKNKTKKKKVWSLRQKKKKKRNNFSQCQQDNGAEFDE